MTLIRWLLRGFVWMLGGGSLQEFGFAFLAGTGVTVLEVDKLLGGSEEESDGEAVSTNDLLKTLALAAECPVETGKSRGLSESFLWKKEADLNVRDWIYLV
jgi:hypothetical protein